jgi:RNA polymerase sigma-70 factor (ECF subfamily)
MVNDRWPRVAEGLEEAEAVGDQELSRGKEFLGRFLKAERRIFAYVYTLVPNRADAEDVFQEVSKVLWEKYDEWNPPDDFAAWACRVAYFKVNDYRRSRRRQRVIFSDDVLERAG